MIKRFKIMDRLIAKSRTEARRIMNDIEPLKPGELVHHINGNSLDNSRKNLCVLTPKLHHMLHVEMGGVRPYRKGRRIKLKEMESLLYLYNTGNWIDAFIYNN